MDYGVLNQDAKALEEAFFARENARLLEELRKKSAAEEHRASLCAALGIGDHDLVERLVALGLCPETAVALNLVPLVEVAWADGSIQDEERAAILKAAAEQGIAAGTVQHQLLESWLSRRPGPELVEAWRSYVKALLTSLGEEHGAGVAAAVLPRARAVAEAAGGFLGLGKKVSRAEERVLGDLERTFS